MEDTAKELGFKDVEEYKAWLEAGKPQGKCSNENCRRPAHWPELNKPCLYCGYPIEIVKT